jgi:hypothetical protein
VRRGLLRRRGLVNHYRPSLARIIEGCLVWHSDSRRLASALDIHHHILIMVDVQGPIAARELRSEPGCMITS